jgi:hypothetical protein
MVPILNLSEDVQTYIIHPVAKGTMNSSFATNNLQYWPLLVIRQTCTLPNTVIKMDVPSNSHSQILHGSLQITV